MIKEVQMTLKEADRLFVIRRLKDKKINLKRAAEELGLCTKQCYRLLQRFILNGAQGLISLRRGKPSNNHLDYKLIQKVVAIIKEKYFDYGPTLIKEKLEEKHKLYLSRETIRQIMTKEGIWTPNKVKYRKIHPRRTRRSRIGELEQIDGSYEYWFEERADKSCLLVCIDDASSQIMLLMFCKTETTENYLKFLKMYLKKYGRPLAFYSDKHSVFRINNKQKYEGIFSTKFQKVLKELDIELICAHSPQAKGRVERANGILQDRLIKWLREERISTIEDANECIEDFRIKYNKKFAKEPADKTDAHRKLLTNKNIEHLCMIQEERTLSKNLSFQYKTNLYQIDNEYKNRLCGKKILIYESDGEIKMITQNGKELKFLKWKEKLCEPTKIIDTKDLEVFWPTIKRKTSKFHPWK
jgi:hypothetical protein